VTLTPGPLVPQATFTTSTLALGAHTISAVYSGDSNFPGSQSIPLSEPVQQADTAILLSADNAPSLAGQPVTFLATVLSSYSGATPTGTITFYDGNTALGTVTVSPGSQGGQALFTASSLALGDHPITAVYSGDGTFVASTSDPWDESILQDSTVSLTPSNSTVASGQTVTFTAVVSSSFTGATPTGTVTFYDGDTILATVTLTQSTNGAQATFSISTLSAGTHSITAVYNGDTTFIGSTSSILSEDVTP
jgi:hypothetical protein